MFPRKRCIEMIALTVWATVATPSLAQPSDSGSGQPTTLEEGFSPVNLSKSGYLGIDFGQSRYSTGCGFGGYRCKNPDLAGRVHVGGLFNNYVGLELGYIHMGSAERAGGRTSAQGVNFSLLGRYPMGAWSAFAKVGTTFGRTEVTADALAGLPTGTSKGWGASFGAGVTYEVARSSALVLEWERHDFKFQGQGKREVQMTTLGYRYKF
jgi:OmpA-OmpF porin, OOP family